ncbi:hypothetical protein [Nocardia sp. NPDC051463]|uniref:hypothetical protein n=1 Tax=Nocardia sp. NPDC051463 TaxID=3154845 RepID=UPI00344E9066
MAATQPPCAGPTGRKQAVRFARESRAAGGVPTLATFHVARVIHFQALLRAHGIVDDMPTENPEVAALIGR